MTLHGARVVGAGKTRFGLWAPARSRVELLVTGPYEKAVPLARGADGYFTGVVENAPPGTRYLYRLDGGLSIPDPASLSQPEGVAGPSEVVDTAFDWKSPYWLGLPLGETVLYELHVGTFTKEGTFDAAAKRLSALKDLGVTAVEVMPVGQFPGARGWGYDGVFPSAAQHSYGGPDGFRRFVDAAHARGLAVVLDVVYNHLGPEGCRLAELGPYFSDRHRNPWGAALNFDGPDSDPVRAYFLQSALWWLDECRVDGLRLDATAAILDVSERPFVAELAEAVSALARRSNRLIHLFAEHLLNDCRVVRPREMGGWGVDAQWGDDLHRSLHALLTGERAGPYADFGTLGAAAKALSDGWVYDGTAYSGWRKRTVGTSAAGLPGRRFIAYWQNHDQVGNRPDGSRAASLVSLEAHKLGLGAVLLSPYTPLLFMGDERGERAPFHFFADFSDEALRRAVREGRGRELKAHWGWEGVPPDPFAPETFAACVLDESRPPTLSGDRTAAYVRELLRLRREHPGLKDGSREKTAVSAADPVVVMGRGEALVLLHFGETVFSGALKLPPGRWRLILDSADDRWDGPGAQAQAALSSDGSAAVRLAPKSLAVYEAAR
ncbi:malto-oligosyltrehalose trehalohydrolase [bacterium]|nr:MAG: malto-oligosyltrehalose trehalohydrolase [bacterium]